MDFQIKRDPKKDLRITCSNKVCSEHLEQDDDVRLVDSQIKTLNNSTCQSLLLWSTQNNLKEKLTFLHCQNDDYRDVLASTFH